MCRGATLGGGAEESAACRCLAACGLASDCLVVDGVTAGDAEAGLRDSRHARTLSALFRGRLLAAGPEEEEGAGGGGAQQTLILAVTGGDGIDEASIAQDTEALFKAIAVERKGNVGSFSDLYDLRVVPSDSKVCVCVCVCVCAF